jgi:diadenylate cyclase
MIRSYELYGALVELAIIWICVFLIFRFLQGTRGAGVVKGLVILIVLATLAIRFLGQTTQAFERLNYLYERFLGLLAIMLIVVFQPELRRAMVRLGHAPLFRGAHRRETQAMADEVAEAVTLLSKNQFGALIAVERDVGLRGLVEGGVSMDAEISAKLLETIFWPNSPLHDLGVVIRGNRIVAASVQFPLAEEGTSPIDYGSRHRAALGLSLETDAVIIVVSEESGAISIAKEGRLMRDIPRDEFLFELLKSLQSPGKVREGEKAHAEAESAELTATEDVDEAGQIGEKAVA